MTKVLVAAGLALALASCGGHTVTAADASASAAVTPSETGSAGAAAPPVTSAPVSGAGSVSASGDVLLTMYLEARGPAGQKQALLNGGELHSGDSFWLFVSAQAPVYLYVLYAAADGTASVLYPEQGELLIPPGSVQRVPQVGDFQLDDAPGWERILIIGSRAPIARSDAQLAGVIQSVRSSHALPPGFFDSPPFDAPSRSSAAAAPESPPPEKKARAKPVARPASKVYEGATPVVEPQAVSGDLRGVGPLRGVRLMKTSSQEVAAIPDEHGIVTMPLLIKHLP